MWYSLLKFRGYERTAVERFIGLQEGGRCLGAQACWLVIQKSSFKSENYLYNWGETLVNTRPESVLPKKSLFVEQNFQ